MHIDVLVELQVKGINKTFTYNVPSNLIKDIEIGKRVLVPFGNRKLEGFIVNINNNEIDYDIKDIIEVIDEYPVLNSELLSIGKYMEKKYLCSLISAYQVMLPKALKASSNTKINKKYITYLTLIDTTYIGKTNTQKEILDLFKINEYILKKQANMISNSSVKTLINKTKISIRKLSTYVDINFSTLSQVANGKRKMSPLYIEKLSRFFCVTSDFLLGLNEDGIFVYYANGFTTISKSQYNDFSSTGMIETTVVNNAVYRVANKELSNMLLMGGFNCERFSFTAFTRLSFRI